jgi:glycine dehydrogenase subunit 2
MADVARYAVLNNNYVQRRLERVPGISTAFPDNPDRRLDVVRYSAETLREETGVGTEDIRNRLTDYGLPGHWMSHHPVTSPEPFTLEPTESASRRDLDDVVDVYAQIAAEAHTDAETVRTAPHGGPVAAWRTDAWEGGWPPAATARLLEQQEGGD